MGGTGCALLYEELVSRAGATIWNKFPNGNPGRADLREYDEDIRSRPEYANYINAEAMISLHTDAADPSARGATVITNLGDAASAQLASNVHCYLTEQITQSPEYADYVIRPGVKDGENYGEVRVAAMPAVLVELGFHTNSEDSAALRSSTFRAAAMRGIEKGYRTFKAGETTCAPLKITSIPDASAPNGGGKALINVNFDGQPTFPLTVKVEVIKCAAGWSCTGGQYQQAEIPSPLTWTFACNGSSTGATHTYKTSLIDADGVRSNPVESNITCTSANGAASVESQYRGGSVIASGQQL